MRLLFREHLRLAHQSFKSSRMRTTLTMLGIAIGIACITTVLSLSDGLLATLQVQTTNTQGSLVVVRPGPPPALSLQSATNPTELSQFSISSLSSDDVALIDTLSDIDAVTPIMTFIGSTRRTDTTIPNTNIVATDPSLLNYHGFELNDGDFISSETNLNTATIGMQLALDLFGTKQPIGQTFSLKGETFTVTGVLERVNTPISIHGFDTDKSVFISMAQGEKLINNRPQLQQINVLAEHDSKAYSVAKAIENRLADDHFNDRDFHVLYGQQIASAHSTLYKSMSAVLMAVASISLVVGGIGIMNIMLVNVSERTREIGLRKAVGASNGNILNQFMIESIGISLSGGLAGLALGYLAAFIVTIFIPFNPSYSWFVSISAMVVALGAGVLFGLYPAIKAARKDPIESLRLYR